MKQNASKTVNGLSLIMGLGSFMRLSKDPGRLDEVFRLSRKLATPQQLESIASELEARSPQSYEALRSQPRLRSAVVPEEQLPPDSLGRAYLDFMKANQLDPNDIPDMPVRSRGDYVLAHLYETHDLWHVLTGFATDVGGELGLQAFYSAQVPSPLSSLLLSTGLLNTALFSMEDRKRRMHEVVRGWKMGVEAKPLFGVDWDALWKQPLRAVQESFNINPCLV